MEIRALTDEEVAVVSGAALGDEYTSSSGSTETVTMVTHQSTVTISGVTLYIYSQFGYAGEYVGDFYSTDPYMAGFA